MSAVIDTHCHLTDPRLGSQLDAVLARAAASGVSHLVTISTDVDDAADCLAVCRRHANVRCALGVHPTSVADAADADLLRLRDLLADPAVIAVGEIGLDYHYGTDDRDRQIAFLNHQLSLAVELSRPLVIHCREAVDDCLSILRDHGHHRGVFHCFTGTPAEAVRILDAGYLIGLTGVVTYKNTPDLRAVAAMIPADRLLVETDAPYLSPEPVRKQRTCEPAFVMHTAARVAAVRGVTVAAVDAFTTANAACLFGWPASPVPSPAAAGEG